jgi:5,10-methylene-tetrahydrofolate dehydrogenase/methenyl tetrahydrofolate cyclohydrolase
VLSKHVCLSCFEYLSRRFVDNLCAQVRDAIHAEIERIRSANVDHAHFSPGLAIVQVGDRPDSAVYIRNKIKAAELCNINARHVKLPATITQVELEAVCACPCTHTRNV